MFDYSNDWPLAGVTVRCHAPSRIRCLQQSNSASSFTVSTATQQLTSISIIRLGGETGGNRKGGGGGGELRVKMEGTQKKLTFTLKAVHKIILEFAKNVMIFMSPSCPHTHTPPHLGIFTLFNISTPPTPLPPHRYQPHGVAITETKGED